MRAENRDGIYVMLSLQGRGASQHLILYAGYLQQQWNAYAKLLQNLRKEFNFIPV